MGQVPKRHSVAAGKYLLFVPDSIDASMLTSGNPYGFALRLNHPLVASWYAWFKQEKGLAAVYPITDRERDEFETHVFRALQIGYAPLKKEDDNEKYEKEKQPA